MKKIGLILVVLTPLVCAMEPETTTKEVRLREALAKLLESRGRWVKSVEGWDLACNNGNRLSQIVARKILAQCPRVRQFIFSLVPVSHRDLQDHASCDTVSCNSTGDKIVVAGPFTAKIWNIESNEMCCLLTGHEDTVRSAVFTPDDRFVVTGSSDGSAKVSNAETGECTRTIEVGSPIHTVAVNSSGNTLLVGCEDGSVQTYDIHSGIRTLARECHDAAVYSVMFNPKDDHQVVTASQDGTAKLLSNLQESNVFHFETGRRVYSALFNEAGDSVLVGGSGRVVMWVPQTGQGNVFQAQYGGIFVPISDIIATISDAGISMWDVVTGECLRTFENTEHMAPAGHQVFTCTRAGDTLLVAFGNWIRIFDIKDILKIHKFLAEEITVPQAAILLDIFELIHVRKSLTDLQKEAFNRAEYLLLDIESEHITFDFNEYPEEIWKSYQAMPDVIRHIFDQYVIPFRLYEHAK